jgi:hypothetical protein
MGQVNSQLGTEEFVIGGYTPGNPFDALIVGYYEAEAALRRQGKKRLCALGSP